MMGKRFVVSKPAELWYSVVVEAESAEEALAKAEHPDFDGWLFEPDWETFAWVDGDWEVSVDGGSDE